MRYRWGVIRWRMAFIIYALTHVTMSHWPHLALGEPGGSSPDKMLHLYAFAGLTGLLWMTGWVRGVWRLGAIMSIWVILDELTQGVPGLGRTITVLDIMASGLGVLIACVWIRALRPVGGPLARSRAAFRSRVVRSLFSGQLRDGIAPLAWLLLAAAFIPVGVSLVFLWGKVIDALPNGIPAFIYGSGIAVWLGALLMIWQRMWNNAMDSARRAHVCPACGEAIRDIKYSPSGFTLCESCNTKTPRSVWLPEVAPESEINRRLLVRPVIIGLVFCVVTFGAVVVFAAVYRLIINQGGSIRWMQRFARELNALSVDFILTIDLAVLAVAVAFAVRSYHKGWSKLYDGQGALCRHCGHDLRATPTNEGLGTCGECGTPFARVEFGG